MFDPEKVERFDVEWVEGLDYYRTEFSPQGKSVLASDYDKLLELYREAAVRSELLVR